ncbi:capsular polysaccharide biosynthesis protein [Leifsonia xyli subsp. cynodontis DSM 46306]|uniref:Uncharacterized protein n=1 Tax=Leifsonia xyli subsp. cynodontis DSM 46306 TaxID=1389489 RepID=U3P3A1_LEIXC|nr:CpsD/CapB family tyrosine-protein kinase [Leifsonia xyli]AGW40800.1 capsular polysaccharide biosynthesis protein [Leifsonia xyli subsp. cynodontis DSM 46306]
MLQDPGFSPNIRVLTAGRTPPNPSELLGSRTMRELLGALSELAVVIVDAPPLLPVTDAAVLSKSVDGVLLVVNAKRTKIDQLGKALRTLDQAAGKLTGVVLNRVPRRRRQLRLLRCRVRVRLLPRCVPHGRARGSPDAGHCPRADDSRAGSSRPAQHSRQHPGAGCRRAREPRPPGRPARIGTGFSGTLRHRSGGFRASVRHDG